MQGALAGRYNDVALRAAVTFFYSVSEDVISSEYVSVSCRRLVEKKARRDGKSGKEVASGDTAF